MPMNSLADIVVKATAGPWFWYGNAGSKSLYLATTHSGRRWVMGFKRWGMSGAQPMFQPAARGLVPASDLCTFEVGDRSVRGTKEAAENSSVYRLDINGIDCADAQLIALAPTLAALVLEARERLKATHAWINNDDADRFGPSETSAWNKLLDATEATLAKLEALKP